MAQSHREVSATVSHSDSDIYMMVEGYVGVLKWRQFENVTPAVQVAAMEGMKQIALRGAQARAKAATAKKQDPAAAISTYLSTFEPNSEMSFQTLGSKRAELAVDYITEVLAKAGQGASEAQIKALVPKFIAHDKHGPAIDSRLQTWLGSYTPPKPRNKSGEAEVASLDLDLDSL